MEGQSDGCGPQGPTAEHKRLMTNVGRWKVACTFFLTPGGPMQLPAIETIDAFGPYFTVSRFEADFGGTPFVGSATTGFDPTLGKWTATWIDVMSPTLFQFTGDYDAEENSLVMSGTGPDPMHPGKLVPYGSKQLWIDDDHRAFEMWFTPEGGEDVPMLAYEYSRE